MQVVLQAALTVRPLLPQAMQKDVNSSKMQRQHSVSLILTRGKDPKDKSGLLNVKKRGMDGTH